MIPGDSVHGPFANSSACWNSLIDSYLTSRMDNTSQRLPGRMGHFWLCLTAGDNGSLVGYIVESADEPDVHALPVAFRVVATLLHVCIFLLGSVGNTVLILVAGKSTRLRTPTYTYLVSLAYADLLVIWCAIPEAILSYHIGNRWVLGPGLCAVFIFINFLGINAGSLSMLAFTIERYLAVCRPLTARKLCTLERTRRIVCLVWLTTVLYCAPWLGLTELKTDETNPAYEQCGFRLSREIYLAFFLTDLVLFYLLPLVVAVVLYTRICVTMRGRSQGGGTMGSGGEPRRQLLSPSISHTFSLRSLESPSLEFAVWEGRADGVCIVEPHPCSKQLPMQKIHMLIAVVSLFAVAWLPFRGLLVYNSFVAEPWLDIWYVFFAKSLIYLNSAINPLLYNIMSVKFRAAVKEYLWKNQRSPQRPCDLSSVTNSPMIHRSRFSQRSRI
ncbi:thyrotropin-releasing hormone receptor-like [Paramacrobiotus metropolitanus]|uniref:thyrotropin-releasing hormone receptor-like n=1 Tax=Paramacrobiotus metropolitanus TaxID=2943436 RepID=UPI00244605FE|nr:thyrotropin-releasing hormone receptor-like [Paramacrobiotus metropolitanus]